MVLDSFTVEFREMVFPAEGKAYAPVTGRLKCSHPGARKAKPTAQFVITAKWGKFASTRKSGGVITRMSSAVHSFG